MRERCDQSRDAVNTQKQKEIITKTEKSLRKDLSVFPQKQGEKSFYEKNDAKDAHYFRNDEFPKD